MVTMFKVDMEVGWGNLVYLDTMFQSAHGVGVGELGDLLDF